MERYLVPTYSITRIGREKIDKRPGGRPHHSLGKRRTGLSTNDFPPAGKVEAYVSNLPMNECEDWGGLRRGLQGLQETGAGKWKWKTVYYSRVSQPSFGWL